MKTNHGVYRSLLVQSVAMASIGVLVNDEVQQLLLFGGVHVLGFIVLVRFRPFSNR